MPISASQEVGSLGKERLVLGNKGQTLPRKPAVKWFYTIRFYIFPRWGRGQARPFDSLLLKKRSL